MLQIERELTTRYSNIHNKFFPQPKPKVEKPNRAIPGNNAVLVSPLDLVPVLDWNINLATDIIPDFDDSVGLTIYPTVDFIIAIVNARYGYTKAELRGKLRKSRIARCRHIISYLVLKHTLVPSTTTGRLMNRDHTTILFGRDKISRERKTDPELDREVAGYELHLIRL